MESNEFKKIFGEIARSHSFEKAHEGWFKEFPEVIQVLDLQKSNSYVKSKKLVKTDGGTIFLRQPDMYSDLLNLEASLDETERRDAIKHMFEQFLTPLSEKTSSKQAIKELHMKGDLFILPAVKEELGLPRAPA